MSNFARIIDSVATDVSTDPNSRFHPDIAAQFVPVPADVKAGWRLVGDTWEPRLPGVPEPEPSAEPAPPSSQKVSPIEFKLLFTAPERVAIKASRDPIVIDFFSIVEDERLTFVDLGLKSTREGLSHLADLQLITPLRRQEILSGKLQ